MKKTIISIITFILLINIALAISPATGGGIEPEGTWQEASWWDIFLNSFTSGSVVTTGETLSNCNTYEGLFLFKNTYTPTSVVNVGGQCSANSQVTLFLCRNNDCNDLVKQYTAYKVNGVNPSFNGFAVDTKYAYKCWSCGATTTNTNTCPAGSNLVAGVCVVPLPDIKGYCLEPVNGIWKCTEKIESACDLKYNWYTPEQLNKCTYDKNFINPSTGTVAKKYSVSCSGKLCTCIENSLGGYTSLSTCNADAEKRTLELNPSSPTTSTNTNTNTNTQTITSTDTTIGCCKYSSIFFGAANFQCLTQTECSKLSNGQIVDNEQCRLQIGSCKEGEQTVSLFVPDENNKTEEVQVEKKTRFSPSYTIDEWQGTNGIGITSQARVSSICSVDENCAPYEDLSGSGKKYNVRCVSNEQILSQLDKDAKDICKEGFVTKLFSQVGLTGTSLCAGAVGISVACAGATGGICGVIGVPVTVGVCGVGLASAGQAVLNCNIWASADVSKGACIAIPEGASGLGGTSEFTKFIEGIPTYLGMQPDLTLGWVIFGVIALIAIAVLMRLAGGK